MVLELRFLVNSVETLIDDVMSMVHRYGFILSNLQIAISIMQPKKYDRSYRLRR